MTTAQEDGTATELEALQKVQRQMWKALQPHLRRFHWMSIPNKTDGGDFWSDPAAVEAVRAYRQAAGKLHRLKCPQEDQDSRRRYYERHTQEVLDKNRAYYKGHTQEALGRGRKYYERHRQEVLIRCHKYYEEHVQESRDYHHKYYTEHIQKALETSIRWTQSHPDEVREIRRRANYRRRINLAGADGSYTEDEFKQLCLEFNDRCAYCGRGLDEVGLLTPDHVIPLSRGGSDYIQNILPACQSCNSSKGVKTFEEFLTTLETLDGREVKAV